VPSSQRSRITAATDFVYGRMRHADAWSSATADPLPPERGFDSLRGDKYCLLTTFRKSGEPVPTPVWFGLADGKVYFRTEAAVGKVKRIRNNPRVRVAPCTLRGRPLGPPAQGRARVLGPDEAERAERAIAANYGLFRRIYEAIGQRLSSIDQVYIEIAPLSPADVVSSSAAQQ
jgi:PPOX class probable F420-dependent enzyme